MPKNVIRFAVTDDATGLRSAIWRIWQRPKDIYLIRRSDTQGQQKISLHHSRNCRLAQTAESAGGPRPADIAWKRRETPSSGFALAVCLYFPTTYLGRSQEPLPNDTLRIPAAPPGNATSVQVFFTRDDRTKIAGIMGTSARLISGIPMITGEFCGIACFDDSSWRDEDVIMPASHHESRELRFTARLPEGVERTILLSEHRRPDVEGEPLTIVERYGYAVVQGTPCVPLTEPHGTFSRTEVKRRSGHNEAL